MSSHAAKNKRTTLMMLAAAFVVIGSYNSIVINTDEFMNHQEVRFVKRLDEVYGVVKTGRLMANQGKWTKIASRAPIKEKIFISAVSVPKKEEIKETVASEEIESNAAIKEELSLELAEVFNAKKYPQPPKASEFNGTLSARDGIIETISVALPRGESFSVNFSEMTGNVFEYDIDGETLSGMIYQMDKSSYMVTLTNGPLEGTRLKFATIKEEDYGNNSAAVAENNYPSENDVIQAEEAPAFGPVVSDSGVVTDVGQFGDVAQAPVNNEYQAEHAQVDPSADVTRTEDAPTGGYGFNFNNSTTNL